MFDWRQYLDVARHLLASPVGSEEAFFRSSATRAYYAAFQTRLQVLARRAGEPIARERVHAEVIRRLRDDAATTSVGLALERLRGKRIHADYNAQRPFRAEDAEIAIEFATDIIGALPSDVDL